MLAYHDRSDGGLFVTLLEMAFAAASGLSVELDALSGDARRRAVLRRARAVVQVRAREVERVREVFARARARSDGCTRWAPWWPTIACVIAQHGRVLFSAKRSVLRGVWSETTHAMQRCATTPVRPTRSKRRVSTRANPGSPSRATFDLDKMWRRPSSSKVAPAPARRDLARAGGQRATRDGGSLRSRRFRAIDVHMSDLLEGRGRSKDFQGLAACGGFSYGDVLGRRRGMGEVDPVPSARPRRASPTFFGARRPSRWGSATAARWSRNLAELIPGAARWPRFVRNRSEQFEARLTLVRVEKSRSVLLAGMEGSLLPIAVSHGEGRAEFEGEGARSVFEASGRVAVRYADSQGEIASRYPENPNGSPAGIAAITSEDGRATLIMPHPERVFRAVQYSWRPRAWREDAPWMRLFRNARAFVG